MRIIRRQYLAQVSPWVLAAAFSLLAIIISVFAVNNYRRDRLLMTDILLEKGVTLIRFVASSARSSIFSGLRAGKELHEIWPGDVQRVLEHSSEQPGVKVIALVNSRGDMFADSLQVAGEMYVSKETQEFLAALDTATLGSRTFSYRISIEKDNPVFQVAAFFPPIGKRFLTQLGPVPPALHAKGKMGSMMMRHHRSSQQWQQTIEAFNEEKYIVLIELDMQQFNERLKRQKLEIIILSIVLFLVGFGGWLSILTLQGLKGSQSRLRRVEAFRDILISSLPVGLIATDTKGGIILYNRFSQELTGISEEKALGGDPTVFRTMPDIHAAFATSGVPQKELYQKEVQLRSDEGEGHTVQLSRLSIIDSDNTFVGTLLMMQDLSQVKQLEKDLRRSERLAALGKMAAGVAHELRNPLSSIKGLALLLQSKFSDDNQERKTADILVQEVERLNRSISELLDFARPQALQKVSVDIQKLLNKAISLLSIDAEASGVQIVTVLQGSFPMVQADEDKLNQVFLNLFLNGIQAMEFGGTLTVSTVKNNHRIKVIVMDTGSGIDPENLGRVFDPYFTTKPDGTGLGMSMSAKIIEEHGGTITIKSEVGKGSSVTVEIPL